MTLSSQPDSATSVLAHPRARRAPRPGRSLSTWALALAAGREVATLPQVQHAPLTDVLHRHGLAPLAYVQTRSTQPDLAMLLRPRFEEAVGRHLRTRAVLGQLTRVFGDSGVEWRVLKGPVLSETAHPVPCVRPYHDLDVLVRPSQLRLAVMALTRADWRLLDADHVALAELVPGELHLLSPSGVQIDLHWSLFNMRRTRWAFPSLEDAFFGNLRSVRLGDHAVPTLGREEFLLHVCLHASLSGGDRLLYLVDIDQLVRRNPPDWSRFSRLASSWGAGPAAVAALGRTRRLLGSPVDEEAPRRMAGASWRALTWSVDRLVPMHRAGDAGSLSRIVARASRPTTRQSWAELRRRTHSRLHDTSGEGSSTAEPALDDEALSAYFSAVLAEVASRRSGPAHE